MPIKMVSKCLVISTTTIHVLSVYSNVLFGSAALLAGPAQARLGCEYMWAYWNDYASARRHDKTIPADPVYHFCLSMERPGMAPGQPYPWTQPFYERSIGCTTRSNGDVYLANWGDMYPFEDPEEYANLEKGVPPSMNILELF